MEIDNLCSTRITNCDLFSFGFLLILHWGRTAFQALESHSLIAKVWKGISAVSIQVQLISNNSRCHSNESTPIVIWVPTDSALGENRFPRLWISFFVSGPNWFLTISDGTTTNPPQFPSGFPVILHWREFALERLILILSGLELWKVGFLMFSMSSQPIPNNSRWFRKESTAIQWERTDYQTFESHSQYFNAVERDHSAVFIEVPTEF